MTAWRSSTSVSMRLPVKLLPLMMTNVYNPRSFEVKTPDVVIKVNPERTDLINTKMIDGRQCLVIELDGNVEVNGIAVRAAGNRASDNSIDD